MCFGVVVAVCKSEVYWIVNQQCVFVLCVCVSCERSHRNHDIDTIDKTHLAPNWKQKKRTMIWLYTCFYVARANASCLFVFFHFIILRCNVFFPSITVNGFFGILFMTTFDLITLAFNWVCIRAHWYNEDQSTVIWLWAKLCCFFITWNILWVFSLTLTDVISSVFWSINKIYKLIVRFHCYDYYWVSFEMNMKLSKWQISFDIPMMNENNFDFFPFYRCIRFEFFFSSSKYTCRQRKWISFVDLRIKYVGLF